MEWLIGALALTIAFFAWLLHGATNNRMKDKEQEIEEWSGVIDVKREIDNKLANDREYAQRVRDKYNKN